MIRAAGSAGQGEWVIEGLAQVRRGFGVLRTRHRRLAGITRTHDFGKGREAKMRFWGFSAVVGASLAFSITAASAEVCDEPLKIGYENWMPFEGGESGSLKGINIDIHKRIS